MNDVETRIDKLERIIRFWRHGLCLSAGIGCLLLVFGADDARKESNQGDAAGALRAKELRIVNEQDVVVFSVTTDAAGGAAMRINRGNGSPLLFVGSGDFGQGGLTVFSKSGRPSAILREGDFKGGLLKLVGDDLSPIIIAGGNKEGDGVILIRSADGENTREITAD